MARSTAVLLAAAMLGAGCGEGGRRAGGADGAPAIVTRATLDCSRSIAEEAAPPATYEVISDAVALPTSKSAPVALQTATSGEPLRLFAKAALFLRPGVAFSMTAVGGWETKAGMRWGNLGHEAASPVFDGRPCNGTGWLVYAGGFFVAEPGCASFDLRVGTTTQHVDVGIGAPCPGQRPPPNPSTP